MSIRGMEYIFIRKKNKVEGELPTIPLRKTCGYGCIKQKAQRRTDHHHLLLYNSAV